jgi:transcriptional regulator with XRE-family HTH domain
MKNKEKETINNRVKIVRKTLGLTQQEFADKTKLKSGNTYSMIERGENEVKEQNILLICTPNQLKEGITVNENWLRTGQGEMFITPAVEGLPIIFENGKELPQDEEELIWVYRKLLPGNKKHVQGNAKIILAAQENTKEALRAEKREKAKPAGTGGENSGEAE